MMANGISLMNNDLNNRVIVAASAAKVAGFEGTYDALIDILKAMKEAKAEQLTLALDVATTSHMH